MLVGPCGVGKSTVAKSLANHANMAYLDFDALGIADMQKRKGNISPFSVSHLNFRQSLPSILPSAPVGFVLDIGGHAVFRMGVDNNERLGQVLWVKKTYSTQIVVLAAKEDILISRFVSTKNRNKNEFYEIWKNWSDIAEPCWRQCGDIFIDTSFLAIDNVVGQIETTLNRSL